mmetsp:Transcript_5181/g.12968  ORF Transcript_5181/g.12968 Transcript_5181/m.12968 type:complete len:152 (-) Transcript_5181:1965-2420(-)
MYHNIGPLLKSLKELTYNSVPTPNYSFLSSTDLESLRTSYTHTFPAAQSLYGEEIRDYFVISCEKSEMRHIIFEESIKFPHAPPLNALRAQKLLEKDSESNQGLYQLPGELRSIRLILLHHYYSGRVPAHSWCQLDESIHWQNASDPTQYH